MTFIKRGLLLLLLITCSLANALEDESNVLKRILDEILDEEEEISEEERIIGGTDLDISDQPWLVSLQFEIPTKTFLGLTLAKNTSHCGGSLIKDKWILTSAHCFVNPQLPKVASPQYWIARLEEAKRESGAISSFTSWIGGLIKYNKWRTWEIGIEKIIVHQGYARVHAKKNHWKNDIALLKLKSAVPPEEVDVGKVSLPAQGDSTYPMAGDMCLAMGWGCKKKSGKVSEYAQKVGLMALSASRCQTLWGVDMDIRLCAGEPGQGKGICLGDSGGPLMCKRHDRWYQAGIASFADTEKPSQYPGVFTRVSAYRAWIEDHTRE